MPLNKAQKTLLEGLTPQTKRMWEGGPLRLWSDLADGRPDSNWLRYQNASLDGFAGSYVCDDCLQPVVGVYCVRSAGKWVCGGCRELVASPKRLDKRKVRK